MAKESGWRFFRSNKIQPTETQDSVQVDAIFSMHDEESHHQSIQTSIKASIAGLSWFSGIKKSNLTALSSSIDTAIKEKDYDEANAQLLKFIKISNSSTSWLSRLLSRDTTSIKAMKTSAEQQKNQQLMSLISLVQQNKNILLQSRVSNSSTQSIFGGFSNVKLRTLQVESNPKPVAFETIPDLDTTQLRSSPSYLASIIKTQIKRNRKQKIKDLEQTKLSKANKKPPSIQKTEEVLLDNNVQLATDGQITTVKTLYNKANLFALVPNTSIQPSHSTPLTTNEKSRLVEEMVKHLKDNDLLYVHFKNEHDLLIDKFFYKKMVDTIKLHRRIDTIYNEVLTELNADPQHPIPKEFSENIAIKFFQKAKGRGLDISSLQFSKNFPFDEQTFVHMLKENLTPVQIASKIFNDTFGALRLATLTSVQQLDPSTDLLALSLELDKELHKFGLDLDQLLTPNFYQELKVNKTVVNEIKASITNHLEAMKNKPEVPDPTPSPNAAVKKPLIHNVSDIPKLKTRQTKNPAVLEKQLEQQTVAENIIPLDTMVADDVKAKENATAPNSIPDITTKLKDKFQYNTDQKTTINLYGENSIQIHTKNAEFIQQVEQYLGDNFDFTRQETAFGYTFLIESKPEVRNEINTKIAEFAHRIESIKAEKAEDERPTNNERSDLILEEIQVAVNTVLKEETEFKNKIAANIKSSIENFAQYLSDKNTSKDSTGDHVEQTAINPPTGLFSNLFKLKTYSLSFTETLKRAIKETIPSLNITFSSYSLGKQQKFEDLLTANGILFRKLNDNQYQLSADVWDKSLITVLDQHNFSSSNFSIINSESNKSKKQFIQHKIDLTNQTLTALAPIQINLLLPADVSENFEKAFKDVFIEDPDCRYVKGHHIVIPAESVTNGTFQALLTQLREEARPEYFLTDDSSANKIISDLNQKHRLKITVDKKNNTEPLKSFLSPNTRIEKGNDVVYFVDLESYKGRESEFIHRAIHFNLNIEYFNSDKNAYEPIESALQLDAPKNLADIKKDDATEKPLSLQERMSKFGHKSRQAARASPVTVSDIVSRSGSQRS
ncbi:MAG: hypothetical protein Q8R24_04525 [Legionellaceae bacterium]|nr:hypothetical protein [Legionellaceae bacterium]